MTPIATFIDEQLAQWPMARANYDNLSHTTSRTLTMPGYTIRVEHNPERIRSTSAKVDAQSVASRPCFLCTANRPAEQKALPMGSYEILINPYPIFAEHLTIVSLTHEPQRLAGHVGSLFAFAQKMTGMAVFFNGAACGASAPDHLHFQAVRRDCLPLFSDFEHAPNSFVHRGHNYTVSTARGIGRLVYRIVCSAPDVAEHAVERLLNEMQTTCSMTNVIATAGKASGEVEIYIVPRRAFRPQQFFAKGSERIMLSPATIEVAGVFIVPVADDLDKITPDVAADILQQTCYSDHDAVLF